ncbi:MAG: arginyltransferase [Cocleimonas sp.]|nr:arginyltransferase [Cocleimonas sp.]
MKLTQPLKIYPTALHACSYLRGVIARNAVIDPKFPMSPSVYDYLIKSGFRRSGQQVYKPYCQSCTKCTTTRINALDFKPSRSQRRNWKANQDLVIVINKDGFKDEYLSLYALYLEARHENDDYEGVDEFLTSDWCDTEFIEFYAENQLIGVATIDLLASGLSAVYTFFDPTAGHKRGLGVFAILWEIEHAKTLALDYVYPGYWIEDCAKMSYKTRYQPIEGLIKGQWRLLPKSS